jgi:hypothetical protein
LKAATGLRTKISGRQPTFIDIWKTTDFHCTRFAADIYLLTYTLLQDGVRLTRRATIWQNTSEGWKILYHQGTIVQEVE